MGELIVYGTSWCGDCKRAKQLLGEQWIPYRFVDIDSDADGLAYVEQVNEGKSIIPVIRFEDGSTLIEPSNAELADDDRLTYHPGMEVRETGTVAVRGEYEPSPEQWVRDEVEHIERTGGSAFRDRPVVLLTTLGARSGKLRKTPLMRVEHAGTYAAVGSMAGADRHPQWYFNVLAHPEVELRDGAVTIVLTAREVEGAERARWWSRACTAFPSYVGYQSRTRRRIPLLLLEPTRD